MENPKAASKFFVDNLRTELNAQGLEEAEIVYQSAYRFSLNGQEHMKKFIHKNRINPSKYAQVKAFHQNWKNIRESLYDQQNAPRTFTKLQMWFLFSLTCKFEKGDKFVSIVVEDVLDNEAEKRILKHEKGQILLINFWSTFCEKNQGLMTRIQQLQEKNTEKWGTKLKIVGLSLDPSKEIAKQTVLTKHWNKLTNYFLGDDEAGMTLYSFLDVWLVDQNGIIAYKGHPSLQKLEENINNLLDGRSLLDTPKEEIKENFEPFTLEDFKKLKFLMKDPKIIEQMTKTFKKEHEYTPNFYIHFNKVTIFDAGMNVQEVKANNPSINLSIRKSDLIKVNPILSRIYEVIPGNKIQEKKEIIETFDIFWGKECKSCNKELKPYDKQYFCPFCKIYFCDDCGELDDNTKSGSERLIHPHNMIWINITNEDGFKEIDEYKLGKNLIWLYVRQV